MDSTPEQEPSVRASSIPLSRRIFRIFILLAFVNIAVFGLLAFISEREHQREVIHYRNEQWLTLGTRYIHSAMDADYLDLLRLANAEFLHKSNLKEVSTRLDEQSKVWPGTYIELVDDTGKVLASGGASSSLSTKLNGLDSASRINILNKARLNQQFVDIVDIDNTIFLQSIVPVAPQVTAQNAQGSDKAAKDDTGKYLLMYKEIDRLFMRNIQLVINHHVGFIPVGTNHPAYIIESIPGSDGITRYVPPIENKDNRFPIQRIENIDGTNKLVSYTPVRNQAGQILGYLFIVDSGVATPGTDLGFILIITAVALSCLLVAMAFYASHHVSLAVGRLRAALNMALSPPTQDSAGTSSADWHKLYSSRQLGDIADLVHKLMNMANENRTALDYAIRDKNNTLIDFQEYKEAVESLAMEKLAAEEAYRELFNGSSQGLFHIDEGGHFIAANDSLARMLGYGSPEQLMSEVSSFSNQVCTLQCDWTEIRSRLTQSETLTKEVSLTRRDQALLHAKLYVKRKETAQDPTVFVYSGMATDLSAQVRLREAENQYRAAVAASSYKSQFLARMSHEIRTPLNAIIGMSELMYETKLNDEQKEYIDILKNAGQSLLGIINDILDFSKVESGKMTLERIPVDITDLVKKIGQQFEISARNKGLDFELQIAPNLPPRIGCDPLRLRQILGNLLTNAIKFTEKGKVSLEVRPHPEAPREIGATTLMFAVSDTGIGVPEQKQYKIFEDFIQADNSVTRRFGGTGLGLSICKILTEMMGGSIMLSSEEDKGTTVYVSIRFEHLPSLAEENGATQPQSRSNTPQASSIRPEADGQSKEIYIIEETPPYVQEETPDQYGDQYDRREQGQYQDPGKFDGTNSDESYTDNESGMLVSPLLSPGQDNTRQLTNLGIMTPDPLAALFSGGDIEENTPRPLKILHVEDNPNNRQIFSLYLRNTPHLLVEAHNGEEAVDAFREHHFDVIFMDIEMPLMDGCQATRILRAMEEEQGLPPTPILAITAHVLPEARQSMFAAGCNEFIAKPYRKIDILGMIDKYGYARSNSKEQ